MHNQVIIAFDFGLKCIGVAVGQTVTQTANPLPVLFAREGVPKWEEIQSLVNEWRPTAFVVGIPLHMDGTEQAITHAARHFAKELSQRFLLPVHDVDERLSTVQAKDYVFTEQGFKGLKKRVDSVAASIILQDWFRTQQLPNSEV